VLKLIGDGTLAIFNAEDREQACGSALAAAAQARTSLAELYRRRGADGPRRQRLLRCERCASC
jgi:adenylate cyclase